MLDTHVPRYPREAMFPTRPRTGLVGREAECRALTAAVAQLAAGPAQLIEITGEPGLGKTRLLTELVSLAARRGIPVVTLNATNGRYGLTDLAQALAEDLVLPARPAWAGPAAADESNVRQRIAEVRTLLCALSTPDGLVVALDDLHRADPLLIRLVGDLVARPPRAALLVAFAHRDRQTPIALRTVPRSAQALTRLALEPLTDAASTVLVADAGPAAWRRTLLNTGGGNPRYLSILAAGARSGAGGLDLHATPAHVTAPLVAELDQLSPDARLAASAAAVLDGCVEPGTVAFVAELTEGGSYLAIDELAREDIVRPTAGTGGFTFRHPVLRHAIYHAADPGWRLAAHARAVTVLRERHADADALAPHLLRVAVPGDVRAAATLAEAAEAIRASSPDIAVTWLRAASRLVPDSPATAERRAGIRLDLGAALAATGQVGEARDVAQEALLADPRARVAYSCAGNSASMPARLRAISLCARLDWQLGHGAQGTALLRRELEQPTIPGDQASALRTELAGYHLLAGRLGEADALVTRALAEPDASRPVVATAHGLRAMVSCLGGDIERAGTECDLAAELLDGLLDMEVAAHLDAVVWVGWSEIILERPWESLRHVVRALRVGRESGRYQSLSWLLAARVMVLRGMGRLREAAAAAAEAVDLTAASGTPALRAFAAVIDRWVACWTGDVVKGRTGSQPAPDPTILGWFAHLYESMYAELVASGDAAYEDGTDPTGAAMDPWSRVAWLEAQVRIAVATGRADRAEAHARSALAIADRLGLPGRRALAQLSHAQVLAGYDPRAASAVATSATVGLAAAGLAVDARRAAVVAGRALAAVDQRDSAETELSGAQQYFEQAGAVRLARDTARLLVRITATSTMAVRPGDRPEPPGPTPLTLREREIAGLVGDGLTNREIARRLQVKEKTVEMHLTRVFTKLGVTNRVGLARQVLLQP